MKLSFTKIFFITIGLSLAFVFFAGDVNAAGCCQLYYKLGSICDEQINIQTKIRDLTGVSTYEPSCLINNYKKIDSGDTGDTLKDKSIGLVKDAYNLIVGTAQWSSEIATDYEEWFGKTTWMIETEDFHCIDGYLDECRSEADSQGVIAFWSTKACDPEQCTDYAATVVAEIPETKIVSPLCWPEQECAAVCKSGECWGGPSSECKEGRGFCFTDPTNIDLAIDIGGVGQVRDVGSYIALMYNYLIGVLVIVAVVMIMYGGFRWITAGGSPERIGDAKRTIVSAVIGLLLGLFSYTILNIINPNILKLELPPIKRVRAIYFEVQPVRCQDYTTEFDCDQNKKNFNADKGGCAWTQFAGFGAQCTTAGGKVGEPGNICSDGNKCSSGWCLGYDVRYVLGPHASEQDSPTRWCTDGTMDMPCKFDTDCKDGLLCDQNVFACVGINSGRPVSAYCDKDSQCSSGFCNAGSCRSGNAGTNCIDGKCAESQGFQCVKFGIGDKCCPPVAAAKGGVGCYINCQTDDQCAAGQYCWKSDARVETESGEMNSRKIGAWMGTCFKKSSSGGRCFNDSGCEKGFICGNRTGYRPDDPAVSDILLGSDGFPISLPVDSDTGTIYTKIQVGTCQSP